MKFFTTVLGWLLSTLVLATLMEQTRAQQPGTLDLTWVSGVTNGTISEFLPLEDGRTLVAGYFKSFKDTQFRALGRLDTNGALNTIFGAQSVCDRAPDTIGSQISGLILLGGSFSQIAGIRRPGLARFNSNGTFDPSFDAELARPGQSPSVNLLLVQPDDKIVITGGFTSVNGVSRPGFARLMPNGRLDTTFEPVVSGLPAFLPDNRVLVDLGYEDFKHKGLVRLMNTGGWDTELIKPGLLDFGGIRGILVRPDGRWIIVGGFRKIGTISRATLAQFLADGTLDSGFDPGSGVSNRGFPNGIIYSAVMQADGRLLLAGDFDAFDGVPRRALVRLNPDGSVDDFDPGRLAGYDGYEFITKVALQPDGKVLVEGQFTSIQGTPRQGIARLHGGGSATPPSIALQPSSTMVFVGDDAQFNISITSSSAPHVQWQFEGRDLAFETNATLVVRDAQFIDSGNYRVKVSNPFGTIISDTVNLGVMPPGPLAMWTLRTNTPSQRRPHLRSVTFGDGRFVAVGDTGVIWASEDGSTWISQTSPVTHTLHSIDFNKGTFVAVGDFGTIIRSTNGLDWIPSISKTSESLRDIAFGSGRFVAVGGSFVSEVRGNRTTGVVVTSLDGVTWTSRWAERNLGAPLAVTYADNRFVAVGLFQVPTSLGWQNYTFNSKDGIEWTYATAALPPVTHSAIVFGNGRLAASDGSLLSYFDGSEWQPARSQGIIPSTFAHDTFIGFGEAGSIFTSTNATIWNRRDSGTTASLSAAAYGKNTFVAVGEAGTIVQSAIVDDTPTPRLIRAQVDAGRFRAEAYATSGLRYIFEAAPLPSGPWEVISEALGQDVTQPFVDPHPLLSRRYYRLRVER